MEMKNAGIFLSALAIFLSIVGFVSATDVTLIEEWSNTFGGEEYSVHQTSDGGYIAAGYALGSMADVLLVKIDSCGTEEWRKMFGGPNADFAYSVQQTSDGGYMIAGSTQPLIGGLYDTWVIKTDSLGNLQWEKTFDMINSDNARSVRQTADGGYIIAGYRTVKTETGSNANPFLLKIDPSGNEQWRSTIIKEAPYATKSVRQTSDGGYLLAGDEGNRIGLWVVKTDASGIEQWTRTFVGPSFDMTNSIEQTSDGGYVVVIFEGLVKMDAFGNDQWRSSLGDLSYYGAKSVQQTSDGGYMVAGYSGELFLLINTDTSGNMQWTKTFDVSNYEKANSIQQASDGGYLVAGSPFWLLKVKVEMGSTPPEETPPADAVLSAIVDLNLKGKWIIGYIELPEGYDVSGISVDTVMLDGIVPALRSTVIGDYDNNNVQDLMVKFDSAYVQDLLQPGAEVELTVTGEVAGANFEGSDTVIAAPVAPKGKGKT